MFDAFEVRLAHAGRQTEPRPLAAVAVTGHGRVDRDAERLDTGRFRAPQEIARELWVNLDVELEPDRLGGGLLHFLDAGGGARAQDVGRAGGTRGARDGELAFRMGDLVQAGGREEQRHCQAPPEQHRARVECAQIRQHALMQADVVESFLVPPERDLRAGAALDVGECTRRNQGLRQRLGVLQGKNLRQIGRIAGLGGDPFRRARSAGQHGCSRQRGDGAEKRTAIKR